MPEYPQACTAAVTPRVIERMRLIIGSLVIGAAFDNDVLQKIKHKINDNYDSDGYNNQLRRFSSQPFKILVRDQGIA